MGLLFSKEKNDPSRIIAIVEGNIGVGKTTLLDSLEELGYNVVREFEDLFEDKYIIDGKEHNILDLFYSDRKKYAFLLQTASLLSRHSNFEKAAGYLEESSSEKEIVFVERSVLTDVMVFEATLYEEGIINDAEHGIYKDLAMEKIGQLDKTLESYSKIFIYLRATPQTCLKRIRTRNRDGEDTIDLEYLTDLHNKHEKWLNDGSHRHIIVDAEMEIDKSFIDLIESI